MRAFVCVLCVSSGKFRTHPNHMNALSAKSYLFFPRLPKNNDLLEVLEEK